LSVEIEAERSYLPAKTPSLHSKTSAAVAEGEEESRGGRVEAREERSIVEVVAD